MSLVWDSRFRVQRWMTWFWVAGGSFDWFPAVCLPVLIVCLCSGIAARPLAEPRQEDNIQSPLCLAPSLHLSWSFYLEEFLLEMQYYHLFLHLVAFTTGFYTNIHYSLFCLADKYYEANNLYPIPFSIASFACQK